MSLLDALIARHFGVSRGELTIGGLPVGRLAARHGTPLFVYDHGVIAATHARLRAALPDRIAICYSMKANPTRALVRGFVSLGCGIEVASAGEFQQALAGGCAAESIIFAGPGKTDRDLETALGGKIGEIHAESLTELERIGRIATQLGVQAQVGLRINPRTEVQGGALRMGGRPAPFGIDEELLETALGAIAQQPAIRFRGVHVFIGTQILDCGTLVHQYRHSLDIARRAARIVGRPLDTVDFGGGFGIPYFAEERPLDLDALRAGLAEVMAEVADDSDFRGTRFVVEPGRFLIGEAGIYVARVTDIKLSRGKKFLVVDGGMHHHLAASGNLGQVIKRNYPVAVLNRLGAAAAEEVDVVGPLCTPLDVLARGIKLPGAEIGDLVGVFQSGAYARASSPLGFLSHPSPPEVLIEAGADRLVRRRGTFDDMVADLVDGVEPRG
jgi:diaminopimelate decarboxylase